MSIHSLPHVVSPAVCVAAVRHVVMHMSRKLSMLLMMQSGTYEQHALRTQLVSERKDVAGRYRVSGCDEPITT